MIKTRFTALALAAATALTPLAAQADRTLVRASEEALPALTFTSVEEDEALLADPELPYQEQLAIRLRLSLKRAAAAEGLLGE